MGLGWQLPIVIGVTCEALRVDANNVTLSWIITTNGTCDNHRLIQQKQGSFERTSERLKILTNSLASGPALQALSSI